MRLIQKITAAVVAAAMLAFSAPAVSAESGTGFAHAQGTQIIGADGQPIILKGIGFGNNNWSNSELPSETHHNEESYKELQELGFNAVRFYLNYALFEDDDAPYEYKQSGFDWLDKNIGWAKKYGIGLILNMHYPQGGYQSQGDGTKLWSDPQNLDRLTKLWTAIAEHCADQPTVIGYGLVNEPYLPLISNRERTIDFYKQSMREMAAAVREAAPEQIIFVERLCNIKGYGWDTVNLNAEAAFPLIDDDNVVYEFHFYEPFRLTHFAANGNPNPPSYPAVDMYWSSYESTWLGFEPAAEQYESNGWRYFETKPVSATEEYNVGSLVLNAGSMSGGTAYFDDLRVTELSADGSRVILEYRFDSPEEVDCFYKWSSDGKGEISYFGEGRFGGCCKISGTGGDLTGGADRFVLEEGRQYVVSGYVRTSGDVGYARPRLDFAKASEFLRVDKDYLAQQLSENLEFSEKHDVPLYLGEFGCCNDSFADGKSALTWIEDMLDLCAEYGLSFNYHAYHEPMFGLHGGNSEQTLPSDADLNGDLADLFARQLRDIGAPPPSPAISRDSLTAMLKKLLPFI